jgi:GDPmannose 4,6-dehydratase
MKRALITGVTGQDGAYLSEFLLQKGYEVHGIKRRSSSFNTARVDHLFEDRHEAYNQRFFLHYGDVTDATNMIRVIQEVQPDEIYNLAAQSHVAVSFETPEYTAQADALGQLRILEALRILDMTQRVRVYQASTSELFGNVNQKPQNEKTAFAPSSPYAVAKLYAYWITVTYRRSYNMFACNGILFNHESPLRGETFVTRKITRAVAAIYAQKQHALYLGNLDAERDWGYAGDYVEAMWLMLQHDVPDDYVIATGKKYSVRSFVESAFSSIGISIGWKGAGCDEVGYDLKTGKEYVFVDSQYFRPIDVDCLVGDATKAYQVLGWRSKMSFKNLVSLMVEKDVEQALLRHCNDLSPILSMPCVSNKEQQYRI